MEKIIKKSNISRLMSLLKSSKSWLIVGVVFAIVAACFGVIAPIIISNISNLIQQYVKGTITSTYLSENIRFDIIVSAVCIGCGFFFHYAESLIMADTAGKLAQRLRSNMNDKTDRIPISFFDRSQSGDLLNRMTTNVETMTVTLGDNVSAILVDLATIIGCVVAMFVVNWVLAIASIIVAILGFVISTVVINRATPYFKGNQDDIGEINGQIDEVFTGHLVVKAFNCENDVITRFENKNQEAYKKDWRSKFYADVLTPVMAFVGNLGYLVVCVVGAILIAQQFPGASIAVIVAFIMLTRIFSTPLANLAQASAQLQPAMAASDRIFELINQDEMPPEEETNKLANVKGNVEFENIKFGYDPNRIILKGFSGSVKAGQKVAIVGPTGAGKTTLVNLLMRFYELNSGNIKIDGTPISDISKSELHKYLGMVLQETWTFEGTIRENIVYSTPNVTDEQLFNAIKSVGLEFFVKSLPNGVDTVINESSQISAGQKQLITIARAMLENAPVLILDEATSSVDTRTEKIIQSAIDSLTKGRTSFVIAHRLSTIKNADKILVMKDGDIVETGNHDELLKKGGLYAELYNSQFDKKQTN